MAVTSAQYTVTTTPVKIVSADIAAEKVHIHAETAVAYIGDSTVSTTTGYKLDINDKVVLDNHEGEVWAVCATSAPFTVLIISK